MTDWLIVAVVLAAVVIWHQRRTPRGSTYSVEEPVTSESLRTIPDHLHSLVVEADIIVRDYVKARRSGSSVGNSFRPRSDLGHSVAAIKNSLILVAAFRVGRADNPNEVLRQLREAYWALAFFPPTAAEAEEEWVNSAQDADAIQEAIRARAPESKSLAGAMNEAGRLMIEFDEEVAAAASARG